MREVPPPWWPAEPGGRPDWLQEQLRRLEAAGASGDVGEVLHAVALTFRERHERAGNAAEASVWAEAFAYVQCVDAGGRWAERFGLDDEGGVEGG